MCGFAGFSDYNRDLTKQIDENKNILQRMGKSISHRGPDDFNMEVRAHTAFAHARLAVVDIMGGVQPMVRQSEGFPYSIVYNGELYNTKELRAHLSKMGVKFETNSDTEVLLKTYITYKEQCVHMLNGIYSFVIYDGKLNRTFFVRDRFGVKPLFYSEKNGNIIFASEIKGILNHPDIEPVIDVNGLCEIIGLGPARSPGNGVFKGIHEFPPGFAGILDESGFKVYRYFELEAAEHKDNYQQTVEQTRFLLIDSIERQLGSDVPLCTLLSGGIDSSIVSSVASSYLKKHGRVLDTYSFDYEGNGEYFKASDFQPSQDRPYVDKMVKYLGTKHTYLNCNNKQLFDSLSDAVKAKDLPGMADVDSSMLFFCRQIKKRHTVCLSGECADEVFGGYPWFRDEEAFNNNVFPWSKDLSFRKFILKKDILEKLPLDDYVNYAYERTIHQTPALSGENKTEARRREISYLNLRWFMTTLLDRKDRTTMASGLEVRVPFADHRLIQYVYNVPWQFKFSNNTVKGLLRDAARGLLPDEVLYRRKSPYPKTYNPGYEMLLKQRLKRIIDNPQSAISKLVDKENICKLMNSPADYGKPWFGQLMAVPQMYAYLIQIEMWMQEYKIKLEL